MTESESEESELFHFFRPRLRLYRLRFAYDLVKTRLSEPEAEEEGSCKPITMHVRVPTLCDWFGFSASASDSDNPLTIWFSLDRTRYISDEIVSAIETLFSLNHKVYASDCDSDSDSVSSEKPPLEPVELVVN